MFQIPAKPKIIKPIQRRQYRKLDEVLPGPDGSSFTSVFSARPEPTPTLRSIPPSELVPNAENARPTPEPAQEANGADILMAEPEISPTHAALVSLMCFNIGVHSWMRACDCSVRVSINPVDAPSLRARAGTYVSGVDGG